MASGIVYGCSPRFCLKYSLIALSEALIPMRGISPGLVFASSSSIINWLNSLSRQVNSGGADWAISNFFSSNMSCAMRCSASVSPSSIAFFNSAICLGSAYFDRRRDLG